MKRGALIVVEGIDRTGKSTQCRTLVERLQRKNVKAQYMNFPNRETDIGRLINSYLTSQKELSDEAIHLLFSANRWENAASIVRTLEEGTSLIVDRYCYSGVAFTAAKGLDINWCKSSDVGLPRPDKVFFLTMPLEVAQQRSGFGNERYEVLEFQKRVAAIYGKLVEDNWEHLDASRSIEAIQNDLLEKSLNLINQVGTAPIDKLWV